MRRTSNCSFSPSPNKSVRNLFRTATTIPELLVVIGVVTILMSLIGPAVQRTRERARAISCRNNLHQLTLAAYEHESTHGAFPYTSTRWIDAGPPRKDYHSRAPHRELMAFLDGTIARKLDPDDVSDPGWTPRPPALVSADSRELQSIHVPIFACPSDHVPAGATSYRANLGSSVQVLSVLLNSETPKPHGAFENGRRVGTSEFRDGLSNTAMFGERVIGDFNSSRYEPFRDVFALDRDVPNTSEMARLCRDVAVPSPRSEYSFAGGTWQLGGWLNTWYSHVLTPNSTVPDCGEGACCVDGGRVVIAPRSLHDGGTHVAMSDGTVRFVATSIDRTIWLAIGTRDSGEPGTE